MSFLNKRTADVLLRQNPRSRFINAHNMSDHISYVDYNKNSIKIFGSLTIPVSSGGWKNDHATFLVSENKIKCLLGLDLQGSLGIDTVQRNPPQVNTVQNVVENSTSELIKSHFVKKFPLLFTRLGRSKSHQVHATSMEPLIPRQIKGRKEPIHIQDRVSEELKSLVRDGHITKLENAPQIILLTLL